VSERFAYDDVPYDTEANAEAHPRAMATLARLHGMTPARPSTARVLEIACGNGDHSIVAAAYMPEARFVGFDLARSAIEAGRAVAPPNVELAVRDLNERARGLGEFDYVIAHGLYSWVPEELRAVALETMRATLAPNGVGFLSMNARPGWELTRALREIGLAASASETEPAKKVAAALARIAEIGDKQREATGFAGALAAHARSWLAHVKQTLPPGGAQRPPPSEATGVGRAERGRSRGAPFSRYVFHDLLADDNQAFSVDELAGRLAKAGLAIVCETAYRFGRAPGLGGLAKEMSGHGTPFLQVLVARDEGRTQDEIDEAALAEMKSWSPRRAPGFEPASRDDLLASAATEIDVVLDPPQLPPDVVPLMRARAAAAVERGAQSAVLTSALHRSFDVGRSELLVVRDLDGTKTPAEIARRAGISVTDVRAVVDRFQRYAFFAREQA
jgi:SAM-dependent methyltransferase